MEELILTADRNLFLFLNGLHLPWLDGIMYIATGLWWWAPLYILVIYLVIRLFGKRSWIIAVAASLLITLSDQSANLSKSSVKRLRPTHDPSMQDKVHTVRGYKGGLYSYYSGHATNTFAFAVFISLLLRKRYRWIPGLLLTWAAIMSYSRIYLGVHYPADILTGAAVGSLMGWLFALIVWELPGRIVVRNPRDH